MEPLKPAEEDSLLALKLDQIKMQREDWGCTAVEGFADQPLRKVSCHENSMHNEHLNAKPESVTLSGVKHEHVETTIKTEFDYLDLHVVQVSDEHIACLTNYILQNASNTGVSQTKGKAVELCGQSGVLYVPTERLGCPKLESDVITPPGQHYKGVADYMVKEESAEEFCYPGVGTEESAAQPRGLRTSLLLLNNNLDDVRMDDVKLPREAHVNVADYKLEKESETRSQAEEIRKVILQLLKDVEQRQDIACKDAGKTRGRCCAGPKRRRPYFCTECGKCFLSPSELKRHHLIHTGEREHSCPECGKEFRQSAHLKSHLLIHSGEKPHSCAKCGKRFRLFAHLKNHLQIHESGSEYCCAECGKKFSSFYHISRHKQSHHVDKQ